MRVALYERRSTNEELQADSLRVQDERLRAFAAGNGHEVVAVYVDSASGRTTKKRDDFRRMIHDVQHRPSFQAILVVDVSRWARFENLVRRRITSIGA